MTIKELAVFTGKTERTVRNWAKKASGNNPSVLEKISNAYETKTKSDFYIDEVEAILNAGSMSKDAVRILMENARQPKELTVNHGNIDMFKAIGTIMAQSMAEALQPLYNRLDKLEGNNKLLLPAEPEIEPRAYLNQLVREYAQLKSVDFRKAWNILYTEILYRCHENIKVKAKNEGIKPVDYLDRENKLLTACSIMKGLING